MYIHKMPAGKLNKVPRKSRASEATKRYVSQRLSKMGETKYHAVNVGGNTETTNTTTTIALSAVSQGDARLNRDGNKIDLRKVWLRYYLSPDVSNTTGDTVRVILWQFKGDSADLNPTTSANTDAILFEQDSNAFTKIVSPLRTDIKDYKVLFDHIHQIPAYSNIKLGDGEKTRVIRVNAQKLINDMRFTASATTGVNQVFLSFIGIQGNGANASCNLNYSSWVAFKDL